MKNFIVLATVIIIASMFLLHFMAFPEAYDRHPYIRPASLSKPETKKPGKLFAYYTQTPGCAPEDLLQQSLLGNGSILDFYVLSFKTTCNDPSTQPHIHYLFKSGLTWTQGRNTLYHHMRGLGNQYQYHIFFDDDSRILLTEDMVEFAAKHKVPEGTMAFNNVFFEHPEGFKALKNPSRDRSAWRVFEHQLLKHSPAYANVAYCSKRSGVQGRIIQADNMKKLCGVSPLPEVTVMFPYDALFIAFHDKALDILFPMYEGYENFSWWISDQIQFHTARVLLRGSGITIWKASVFNMAHANYPRGGKMDWNRWNEFLAKEGKLISELSRPHKKLIESLEDNDLFADVSICGKHIRFPVHEHYKNIYGS